ncbi:unnamed protein product [Adineta ricciae]|uniref:Uncharacterized protein n=1 Tax=Adineta ricciae TaxID=249248 RepID=A0A815SJA9_ADIRI|nr:unnamed protein product [Adineta ricciae]
MIKVYGVIGDTPALNLILNHKSHVGYSCCWYCHIIGTHIGGKRQYYYDENVSLRSAADFEADSRRAESLGKSVNGRHGTSILKKVVDIPLPDSIVADYLHTTLLGHAKAVCVYLYKQYMRPQERIHFNKKIRAQRFPHFFNRKIRTFEEPYLKATEIRNMFLFCILPMIREILHVDLVAHLALFVLGIRLLHGRPEFGNRTADIANKLLTIYYRDHETFYVGLQNFVLHIHSHFADLYKKHGSLCNINTFSQEDLMGVVSKLKHGANHWADQLVFYLNIDFALNNEVNHTEPTVLIRTPKGVFDNTLMPNELCQVVSSFTPENAFSHVYIHI